MDAQPVNQRLRWLAGRHNFPSNALVAGRADAVARSQNHLAKSTPTLLWDLLLWRHIHMVSKSITYATPSREVVVVGVKEARGWRRPTNPCSTTSEVARP